MKDKAVDKDRFLKFSIHPSFLENPYYDDNESDLPCIKYIRELFRSLLKDIKLAQQKKDIIKHKKSSFRINSKIEFTKEDETEISRSDGYKISEDLSEVSVESFKGQLKKMGINNPDMLNFMLQIVLQQRLGIHISLVGAISSIPINLADSQTGPLLFPANRSSKASNLSITYNKTTNVIRLIYSAKIIFGILEPIEAGSVKFVLAINPDLQIKIEQLYWLLFPPSEVRKRYKNRTDILLELNEHLTCLRAKLCEQSSISLNPHLFRKPLQPLIPRHERSSNSMLVLEIIKSNPLKSAVVIVSSALFLTGLILTICGCPLGPVLGYVGIHLTLSAIPLTLATCMVTAGIGAISAFIVGGMIKLTQTISRFCLGSKNINTTLNTSSHTNTVKPKDRQEKIRATYRTFPACHKTNSLLKIEEFIFYPNGIIGYKNIESATYAWQKEPPKDASTIKAERLVSQYNLFKEDSHHRPTKKGTFTDSEQECPQSNLS